MNRENKEAEKEKVEDDSWKRFQHSSNLQVFEWTSCWWQFSLSLQQLLKQKAAFHEQLDKELFCRTIKFTALIPKFKVKLQYIWS